MSLLSTPTALHGYTDYPRLELAGETHDGEHIA
jgi:hypothetical protein